MPGVHPDDRTDLIEAMAGPASMACTHLQNDKDTAAIFANAEIFTGVTQRLYCGPTFSWIFVRFVLKMTILYLHGPTVLASNPCSNYATMQITNTKSRTYRMPSNLRGLNIQTSAYYQHTPATAKSITKLLKSLTVLCLRCKRTSCYVTEFKPLTAFFWL